MARNRQTRSNKRMWGLVSSMEWKQMPCYVPSRNSDNIKKTRHHYLLTIWKAKVSLLNSWYLLRRTLHRPTSEKKKKEKKKLKLEDLIQEGQSAGWVLKYFPVEVWSRGFINNTLHTCFKFFGLTNKENQKGTELCFKNSPQELLPYSVACKKHQAIWKLGVGELPIHPTHQPNWRWVICFTPNRIRTLWPAWPWMVLALFKMFLQCKAFPVGSCWRV